MREAFNYMFKDNFFKQKLVIYFVFVFCSMFCMNLVNTSLIGNSKNTTSLLSLLVMVFLFIPSGYMISAIKAIICQKENIVLPVFNYKNNFLTGFKYFVSAMLPCFLLAIVSMVVVFIVGIVSGILKMKLLFLICSIIVVIFPILLIAYFMLAFVRIFAEAGAWTSFLQFKRAHELIKKSPSYNKCFGVFFLINTLLAIVSALIFAVCGKALVLFITGTIIVGIISTYFAFVNMYIMAKAVDWRV